MMDSPEWLILTLLRFIIPLSILRWPLAGIIASILADVVLSDLLGLPHGGFLHYQIWDKVLDTYYLALAAYTVLAWKDKPARSVALFAFGYRAIGVLLFIATENQSLLFLFPNFFENFFIFYLLFRKMVGKAKLFSSNLVFAVIITAVLLPKLAQEFFMHAAFVRPNELLGITAPHWLNWLIPAEFNLVLPLQWLVYIAIPLTALLWRVGALKRFLGYISGTFKA